MRNLLLCVVLVLLASCEQVEAEYTKKQANKYNVIIVCIKGVEYGVYTDHHGIGMSVLYSPNNNVKMCSN